MSRSMKWTKIAAAIFLALGLVAFPALGQTPPRKPATQPGPGPSFAEARHSFKTHIVRQVRDGDPAPKPPAGVLNLVRYKSPAGDLSAYITPDPRDGKKHPAIVWIFGGFSNGIGDTAWENAPADNDQSASAFRKAAIVTLYPSFRGGNDNPGVNETFFGEVDDALAAADYLARQPYVDPARIYLGGHSTGGTLALLTAEASHRFRAVFCFGPVATPASYGRDKLNFDLTQRRELLVRAPIVWLNSIKTPVFVFEGTKSPSNLSAVELMKKNCKNDLVHFCPVENASHFSILQPATKLMAEKILHDDGATSHIEFTDAELNGLIRR